NPIVITGDVHSNWVMDIHLDWKDQKSPIVATEYVGTSITSGGDGSPEPSAAVKAYLPENPHIHFYNSQRGYVRCKVTPDRFESDYRVVPYVSRAGAPIETIARYFTENGKAGAQKV